MTKNTKQVFFWHGDNDYEMSEQLGQWIKAFEKKYSGFNIFSIDAGLVKNMDKLHGDLKNAVQVDSLFGANKLIVLRNFLAHGKKINDEISDILLNATDKIAPGFFMIFMEQEKFKKTEKFYKEISKKIKAGKIEEQEFVVPATFKLPGWIENRVKKYDKKIERKAVDLLTALVGADLWQLANEIEKLVNYQEKEIITEAEVKLLVQGKYNDDIFQLMDAITAGDKKLIVKLMNDELASGAGDIYIISMLARQFRILLGMKELAEAGMRDSKMIASKMQIHPFVAKKTYGYLNRYSMEQLKMIFHEILKMDIALKTKSVDFMTVFSAFTAKL